MELKLLPQIILVFSSAVIIIKSLKLNKSSFFYLCLLPFLVFFQGEIQVLFFALLFGVLLSLSIFHPSFPFHFTFLALLLFFIIYHSKIGVNDYSVDLHFINQQRGEHLIFLTSFIPRFFHNKLSFLIPDRPDLSKFQ